MRDRPDDVYSSSYETLNKQLVAGARTLAKLRAERDEARSKKDTAKVAQRQEAIDQLSNLWMEGERAIKDYVERTQDMINDYKQEAKDAPNAEARTEAENNVKYFQDVLKRLNVREGPAPAAAPARAPAAPARAPAAPARAPAAPAQAPAAAAAPRLSATERQGIERKIGSLEDDIRENNAALAEERKKTRPNESNVKALEQALQEGHRQLVELRRKLNPQQR